MADPEDARFIAAADPVSVAALLAERDGLAEALRQIETLLHGTYRPDVRSACRVAHAALDPDSWIDEEVRAHRREKRARIREES